MLSYNRAMFAHLKYLTTAGLLIMIIGAVGITFYFRDFKENDLLQTSAGHMEAVVASYNNAIWDRYAKVLYLNPQSPYSANFQKDTDNFFKKHGLEKITIFSPDLKYLYFPTDGKRPDSKITVTTDGTTRVTLFDIDKVIAGHTISRMLNGVYLNESDEPTKTHRMIQVIAPLARTGEKTPEALVEIYADMGNQWEKVNERLYIFLGAVLVVFTLVTVVLLTTASRAEGVITRQHEVNLELIAAAAQAEAKSRDKSQFLASVSHELRTPLNAIIGFSDIIRSEAKQKLEKIHQEYVDDINASGKHLLSLINDILDFSKAEAGKLQIEWAETDVTKVIRNSLRMVMPRAETAQVTLVEDLPGQHLVVVTDAKKIKQVLLNLLSNAVKFTPAGGEVRCHAWVDILTGAVNIQVRDTGIGIAPKDISRVMTPFGQVDSTLSRKYEGTGLGLPLAKKFVESMGGVFSIESELKVGTSVTFTIPKAPANWGSPAMNDSAKGATHVTPKSA